MPRGLVQAAREFPGNLKEMLTAPKTLLLNIVWLCILIYLFTDFNLLIFLPVLIALWFTGYDMYVARRDGYRLELWRKLVVALLCASALGSSFYGYFYISVNDIQTARFPEDVLNRTGFVRDSSEDSSQLLLYGLLRIETRGFKYDDRDLARPPYPGEVWLVTLRTVFIPPQELVRDQLTSRIEGLKINGLTIYKESRREGRGALQSGHETEWVEYNASLQVTGMGALMNFPVGAKIKVRAEWWPCPEHGTVVIVIGAAQYGTEPSGSRIRDIVLPPGPDDMRTYDSILRLSYSTKCA